MGHDQVLRTTEVKSIYKIVLSLHKTTQGMIILGINFGHDCSVALLRDGKLLAAIEEEKVSRKKQDFGWPRQAIDRLLAEHEIKKGDVNYIVFPSTNLSNYGNYEVRFRFTKNKSDKQREYARRVAAYVGLPVNKAGTNQTAVFEERIREEGFSQASILSFNHHLAHAASAYYASPIELHLILTSDGHGEESAFNFYRPTKDGLELLHRNDHTTSVGAFYSMITKLLGFRPTRHEGKITGLAAYGKPTELLEKFRSLFQYQGEKLTRYPFDQLDTEWQKYRIDSGLSFSQRVNLKTSEGPISIDYAKRSQVLFKKLEELTAGYSKEDISFACQKVAEEVTVEELRRLLRKHFANQSVAVGLAGGVFANVRINQMIYETEGVNNVFVQPAMGDSGLAFGLAVLADIELNKRVANQRHYAFTHTYVGPNYSAEVETFLKEIESETRIRKMEKPAEEIAQLMKDNQVIGFWHGSMEWGPRALGKRSMILNTFDRTVNDSVNKRLSRTEFMPFAPSILDFMMPTYIPSFRPDCPAGDYMTITYDVDPKYHEELQAVVHVDGTARPQVVKRETNPYYYDILHAFYKLTGCGAIVNTSFNAHEEPIVSSPRAAYKALQEDRIDCLVLEEYLIYRK
jgi:carbamoyltransferase